MALRDCIWLFADHIHIVIHSQTKKNCYSESNICALSSFSTENFKADLHYFFPSPSYWTLKIVLTSHWMSYNLCSSKIHRLGATNVRSLPHYMKIMFTTHYSTGQTVPTYIPIQIFWTRLNTKIWKAVSLLSQRCIQYNTVKIYCLASAEIIEDSRTKYKWTNSKIPSTQWLWFWFFMYQWTNGVVDTSS